jgi:predicted DNA-binding protein
VSVILDIKECERLLEALEDLEDLRTADEALAEIERGED